MALSLDGTGASYLTRAVLPEIAAASFPFWIGAWVRVGKDYAEDATAYAKARCVWANERTDETHGFDGIVYKMQALAQSSAAGSFDSAASDSGVIPDPYWEHITWEYRSASDRRVVLNGVQDGPTNATPLTPDLSTGSPVFRIGIRSNGNQAFTGLIADVTVGTGTLRDADRALLATPGANYATVAPTGGSIAHWYPLASNGNDSISGANMSNGGVPTYVATTPSIRATPTPADAIQYWFTQPSLRSETPAVLTGQVSPISAMTNLASCEYLNVSFSGACGVWTTRLYHLIPTSSLDHLVIVDGGHEFVARWNGSGTEMVIRALVAAGYAVLIYQMPACSPSDPLYDGLTINDKHTSQWSALTGSANPMERFIGPLNIALNELAPRYTKRSIVGLSGGAWMAPHLAAVDPRINHAVVACRGTIAPRRRRGQGDFEQMPKATGWVQNDFYRLAARNARLWLVHHPSDTVVAAKFDTASNGAYLDAASYRTSFITPISDEFAAGGDIQFIESLGTPTHNFDDGWQLNNAILPALSTSFTAPTFDISIAPTSVSAGATQVLTLTGVGTLWDSSTVFTVGAGASKITHNVTSRTSATVTVLAGGGATTVTVSDGVSSATFAVSAAFVRIFDPAIFDGPALFDTGETFKPGYAIGANTLIGAINA
jgi:hypothetical protein